MSVTRARLLALRAKYHTLAELRVAREETAAQGFTSFAGFERHARKVIMRGLALPFPGALRELEEATAAELAARRAALDVALGGGPIAPWMEVTNLFHEALRDALLLRRGHLTRSPFWGDDDAAVRAPPTGRLLDVVWTAVGARAGLTAREAELLVYPRAQARGARR